MDFALLQSENWFREIVNFRSNPAAYFSNRKLVDESFLHDVLQALCTDTIQDAAKIHLLGLLQEYGSYLFQTASSIEQTVASLQDMFSQSTASSTPFYRGHILTTITTVLVSFDQLNEQPQLFKNFIDLLLDVVSKVNVGDNRLLRGTACQCLQEVEVMYPGILLRKLEHFYQMSQLENTNFCQNYISLFVTILKNTLIALTYSTESVAPQRLTALLCNRTEPLKPLNLPPDTTKVNYKAQVTKMTENKKFPETVDVTELKKVVTQLMSWLVVLTPSVYFSVLCDFIKILQIVPSIGVSVIKSHLYKNMSSSELALFYLPFCMKSHLGDGLFTKNEEELLLSHLMNRLNHPSLSAGQKLLLYDWVMHFPDHKGVVSQDPSVPYLLQPSQYHPLFPRVFDGTDTQLKKISILNLCYSPSDQPDSSSAVLMSAVKCLHKLVQYGVTGRAAVALFRALFFFYKRHHKSCLVADIQKFLTGIVTAHPKFAPHLIDFLACCRETHPESSLPLAVLSALSNHIVSLPETQVMENLLYNLQVLERAAQEPGIAPKPIVEFCISLLKTTTLCVEGNWRKGNGLLAVCRSILQYHNTNPVHVEFGDLLYLIFTFFEEVDIRDRARFYYAVLTNLSSDKTSGILLNPVTNSNTASQTLTSLMTGSTNFPTASPVITKQEPVLNLIRCSENEDDSEEGDISTIGDDVESTDFSLIYKKSRSFTDTRVTQNFQITLVESIPELEEIYTLVLHFTTDSNYEPVKEVCIPCLSLKKPDGTPRSDLYKASAKFSIHFKPWEPVAATFNVCAIYTGLDGRTYASSLGPIELRFEDLFLPLAHTKCSRHALVNGLWKIMSSQEDCTESVFVIETKQKDQPLILNSSLHWKLIGGKNEDGESLVGMNLPPNTHLLMKQKPFQGRTVVSVLTDNWRILPSVYNYLLGLAGT